MASLATIAIYYEPSAAFIAKSLLEQHGFTVFLHDTFYTQVSWGNIVALGGLRLTVPEPEAKDAAYLLTLAAPVPPEEADAIDCCPGCGSDNVARYAHWLNLLISLLTSVGSIFVIWSKRRRCRKCGLRWRI